MVIFAVGREIAREGNKIFLPIVFFWVFFFFFASHLPNPTFVPSLGEIGLVSFITSLVLPRCIMDTVLKCVGSYL